MTHEFNSYIYTEDDSKVFKDKRKDLIGWLILALAILFIVLELPIISLSLFGIIFIWNLVFIYERWNKEEPLNGVLHPPIKITTNSIYIHNQEFKLSEIDLKEITTMDYIGRTSYTYSFGLNYIPQKSNGTWNHLRFNLKADNYNFRFLIHDKHQKSELEELKKIIENKNDHQQLSPNDAE
jgi:hypothetical protein